MKKKFFSILLIVLLAVPLAAAAETKRVVLIGNQRFGDLGPMDDFARGLDQCAENQGYYNQKVRIHFSRSFRGRYPGHGTRKV